MRLDSSFIKSRKLGVVEQALRRLETFIPKYLIAKFGSLASVKNKILISTWFITIAVVFIVGVTLQYIVFPTIHWEQDLVFKIKIIHFTASVLVIAVCWVFIEYLSKKITRPLDELTRRADEISREAGKTITEPVLLDDSDLGPLTTADTTHLFGGDEIEHLTTSFNRMLVHLQASQESLRESEAKYRFLFDDAPTPIFVIDADTMKILDVNARAPQDYLYSREELLNMSFFDLWQQEHRDQAVLELKQQSETSASMMPVLQHMRRDGSTLMMHYHARLTRYNERQAIIVSVWDVTEKLERQTRLIQAGKMATLGEMATGIAHELNQPLNAIRIGCDYLSKHARRHKKLSPEDLANISEQLNANVDRASRIINHLRQFGRRAELDMKPMDVNLAVNGVITLLGAQLEKRGIHMHLETAEDLPPILGDVNRLEQVLMNLVVNARDAVVEHYRSAENSRTVGEKVISIRSYYDGDRVVVTVSDSGAGVPQSIRHRIFEPFFTTKQIGEGTGLGLSISYGIIKEHRGSIELDDADTPGTTFRITFPVHDESRIAYGQFSAGN
jgi:PAS domain S-box-containing protein